MAATRLLRRLHRPLNGESVKSCTILAVQADGGKITDHRGHRLDWQSPSGPGRLLGDARPPVRLLHPGHDHDRRRPARAQPEPDRSRDPARLEGNICRCTGYQNIVKSIQWAAEKMRIRLGPGVSTSPGNAAGHFASDGGRKWLQQSKLPRDGWQSDQAPGGSASDHGRGVLPR